MREHNSPYPGKFICRTYLEPFSMSSSQVAELHPQPSLGLLLSEARLLLLWLSVCQRCGGDRHKIGCRCK